MYLPKIRTSAGLVAAFASANADQVPANLKSADYIARASRPGHCLGTVKAVPRNRKSGGILTQPAFKDKVTTPDPALSGASLDLLIGLQNSMGDQALATV